MDNRPVLIISCSQRKFTEHHSRIFDLYDGQIFRLISANISNPTKHLKIFILSAKHGLCDADSMAMYADYDEMITARTVADHTHAHHEGIISQARSILDRDVTIVLPKAYLSVFTASLDLADLSLTSFTRLTMNPKPRGIGDHQYTIKSLLTRKIK